MSRALWLDKEESYARSDELRHRRSRTSNQRDVDAKELSVAVAIDFETLGDHSAQLLL